MNAVEDDDKGGKENERKQKVPRASSFDWLCIDRAAKSISWWLLPGGVGRIDPTHGSFELCNVGVTSPPSSGQGQFVTRFR